MIDYTKLSFQQMADEIESMRIELKRRNPIFVNLYTPDLDNAVSALEEIHQCELRNPSCEYGLGVEDSEL